MKQHRQSNKKTHIQYCLWTVLAISTTRRRWQNRRVWRKNSAVQAPDQQYIISHKILTILKIVHTRPDVSSRQLPPYSNSGKLLITDSFAHAYQHATAIIQTIKLCTMRTARCLDINCVHAASRTCSDRHV